MTQMTQMKCRGAQILTADYADFTDSIAGLVGIPRANHSYGIGGDSER